MRGLATVIGVIALCAVWAFLGYCMAPPADKLCAALNAPTTLTSLAGAVELGEYTPEQAEVIRDLCDVEGFGPLPVRGEE